MFIRDAFHSPPRARLLRPIVVAALALQLAACASLAPADRADAGVQVPAAWSQPTGIAPNSHSAASLAQWWTRFDDPLLSDLVSRALLSNTSVASAQAALRQARALDDVERAGLGPTLNASASAQRGKSGGASASNVFQAGFDASWEPDVFGGQRAGVAATSADAQASAASLGDIQVSIAAEVAVTYMNLRGAQARLTIAQQNLAAQQETLQLTQWRAQAGLAASLDVEQASTAVEQTRAQIPALQTTATQAMHALAVLTGQPPAALNDTLSAATSTPQADSELALTIPAETLRQRPDVRAAEHHVSAALARVTQADAARYPSFRLGGSLGLSALTLASLDGGASVVSALLGAIDIPLFDGGAATARVSAQEAALDQARESYRAAVLAALKDVEDALVALRHDRTRLASLQAAAQSAQNAALLARQRYESGLVDFQTVLDTQRTLLSTQDSVESTTAELNADHVRLYKALGGGWQGQNDNSLSATATTPQPTS